MMDRTWWAVVVILLAVNLAVQVGLALRPPQRALLLDFAQLIGQKEAELFLVRAGNQQLTARLADCQKAGEKK